MNIFNKFIKNTLKIKNNIKNIFLYDCNEYIEKRKENYKRNQTTAFYENDEEINSEKIIFSLFFLLIFLILATYYVYIDFKSNVVKNNITLQTTPLNILINNPMDSTISNNFNVLKYKIESGDTLIDILMKKVKLNYSDSYKVIKELNKIYSIKNLMVGQELIFKYKTEVKQSEDNAMEYTIILDELRLKTQNSNEEAVVFKTINNEYTSKTVKIELIKQYEKYIVKIKNSIYVDGIDAGIPPSVLIDLMNYFSFDFDFVRDIRENDYFEVLFENFYTEEGKRVKNGEIIFAKINSRGKDYNLYRFDTNRNGIIYFDENGISSNKSLLRTPINGARISSPFNPKRKHPVLGYTTAHRGVDFAAPTGTPFFAGGNGTITMLKRGYNGGYGNYIRIRHTDEYSTAYAHISRFSKNIYVGKKVKQGEVIAYVGATGRVTGPHLHYEILYKNRQINPSTIKSIANIKLIGKELITFNSYKEKIDLYRKNIVTNNY